MALPPFLVVPWARNVIGELILFDLPSLKLTANAPFKSAFSFPKRKLMKTVRFRECFKKFQPQGPRKFHAYFSSLKPSLRFEELVSGAEFLDQGGAKELCGEVARGVGKLTFGRTIQSNLRECDWKTELMNLNILCCKGSWKARISWRYENLFCDM